MQPSRKQPGVRFSIEKTQKKLRLVRLIELLSSYRVEIMCRLLALALDKRPTSHPNSHLRLSALHPKAVHRLLHALSALLFISSMLHTNQSASPLLLLGPLFSCIFTLSSPKFRARTPRVSMHPDINNSRRASLHLVHRLKDHFSPLRSGPNYPCPCIPVQPVIGHMLSRYVTHT